MAHGQDELCRLLRAEGDPLEYQGTTYYALLEGGETFEATEGGGQIKVRLRSALVAPCAPNVQSQDVVTLGGTRYMVVDTQRLDDDGLVRLYLKRT